MFLLFLSLKKKKKSLTETMITCRPDVIESHSKVVSDILSVFWKNWIRKETNVDFRIQIYC